MPLARKRRLMLLRPDRGLTVCKEPREEVGRLMYGAQKEQRAKREAPQRPGRFVPEARDSARLLPRLQGAFRR